MELLFQWVMGSVMGLALVLLVWLEKLKDPESELESAHYLDLRKDSALAQELSLSRLLQEQELEQSGLEQHHTAQE
jgi:hypothetical protein